MGNTPCGHTITGAGCEVVLNHNGSVSSGTCLTLGRGVKLTGNNKTITCTSTNADGCGTGIAVTQTGSGTTLINNVNVVGPWTTAVYNTHYNYASQANYVDVDLNDLGSTGIDGFKNINSSTVSEATDAGIVLRGSATVHGSWVKHSEIGVTSTADGNTLENTLLDDNGRHIMMPGGAYYEVDLRGATLLNSTLCDCGKDFLTLCYYDITICSTRSGTNVTFVDDGIWE